MIKVEVKIYCLLCKGNKNHFYIDNNGKKLQHITSRDNQEDFSWVAKYSLIQCMGCDNVAFLYEYSGDDTVSFNSEGEYEGTETHYTVYPEEPKQIPPSLLPLPIKKYTNVPDFINSVYVEVINAYNSNSAILCAVGLRTIIEAICIDAKINDGHIFNDKGEIINDKKTGTPIRSESLVGKINGLCEIGVITKKQSAVLHQVRELGNYAVHEIELPARRTVKTGVEVISNILLNIYELEIIKISPKHK